MVLQGITSVLWLSLEKYYNQGLTPERAKELIEKIPDPGSLVGGPLRCESARLNGNWNVHTSSCDSNTIYEIIDDISLVLDNELKLIQEDNGKEEEIYANRYREACQYPGTSVGWMDESLDSQVSEYLDCADVVEHQLLEQ